MAQAVSRRPFRAKARIPSQASTYELCGGRCGTVASFAQNISVFSCQYNFTNDPYSPSTICCSYQKGKQANTKNFIESNALVGNRRERGRKVLLHFSLLMIKYSFVCV